MVSGIAEPDAVYFYVYVLGAPTVAAVCSAASVCDVLIIESPNMDFNWSLMQLR